jgi:predicted MFS family arabinose efflux permease
VTLSAATFATVTAEMMPAGLLPSMSAGLHVPPARIGLLVSAWALTVAITSIPLLRLTTGVPRRRLLVASLVIFALAVLATAVAPTFPLALAGRVASAVAHGLFWSVVVSYAADLVPDELVPRAIAVVLAGPTVAAVVGVPLTTWLGEVLGWRAAVAVAAGLLGAAAVLVAAVLPHPAKSVAAAPGGAWDSSARRVLLLAMAAGLLLVGHFAVYTYVAPLLTERAGLHASAVAGALLVFGVAGVLGVVLSGPVSERWPVRGLGLVGAAFALAMAVLLLLPNSGAAGYALLLPWGVLIGLLPPVFQARVLRSASERFRPFAGAVVVVTLNLGIAAGALLGGGVLDTLGLASLTLVALAPVAVGVGLLTYGIGRAEAC